MFKRRVSIPVVQPSPGEDDVLRVLFDNHFSVELAISPELINEVLELRYQVYCRERPFEDADCFPDGRERDDYDHRSVHALVRHRGSNQCVAAVRLVLADEEDPAAPFPVEEHCSEAMPAAGMEALETTPRWRVAEISRLAVSREIRQRMGQTTEVGNMPDLPDDSCGIDPRVSPYIVVGLFAAVLRLSAKLGITHWLAVMEPTLLRLLKRYGIHFPYVGHVIEYHGRRRPAIAQACTMLDGIQDCRPDVWDLMTDAGAILPARPVVAKRRPRTVSGVISGPVASDWLIAQPRARPMAVAARG